MKPRRLVLLAVVSLAVVASSALALRQELPKPPPAPARLENPTRLLVKLKEGATKEQVAAAHASAGGRLLQDLPQIRWQIVEVPYGKQREIARLYLEQPAIERADLDHARRVAYVPNDPYWPWHWHLQDIKADLAWDTEKGDPSVVVAVMDTGLDASHADLSANVWTNPGEIAGNGIDDDGNGYVDDVHGYDFAYVDSDPNDVYGHGTACAGIVAAVQDNSLGVTGVAPQCRIAGVKAANDSGYFYDSANVPAFLYCADMGFKVISMSFFSDDVTPAERDAVDYCWKHGMVLVAAAGNSLSVIPYYPGAYEHVVSVAATDSSGNPTWFTDYGSWVDVAAPGVGIATTTVGGGYTTSFAGTSAACPHVAGLAALLFSADPSATNADVRAALEDTATATISSAWGEYTNYGKVDCDAAVDRVQGLTSGSKTARVLFVAPVGGETKRRTGAPLPELSFHGVGFEMPNSAGVWSSGKPMPILGRTRRLVRAALDPAPTAGTNSSTRPYSLSVNATTVGRIVWESGAGFVYAPTDVGTYSATVTGGFFDVYRVDGNVLTCDDDGSGSIYCEMPVRKVRPPVPNQLTKLTIEFTRSYDNCNGGLETLYLYDWSTWSYPYGSFTPIASTSITSSSTQTITVTITVNPGRYLDDEGTMYFVLSTSGATSTGLLKADAFRVRAES
jgi:subtilisin family serine protease